MRLKLTIAGLVLLVAALGSGLALSGGSSGSRATVAATPSAAPMTAAVTATPSPSRATTSPTARPTHRAPIDAIPGPNRPTVHAVPPPAAASTSTARCQLAAGAQTIAGRTVILDLPARMPAPVILDFHGGSQSAEQEHGYTGLGPYGAASGFVVATPNGTNGLWNFSGTEPLPDDAAFTTQLLAALAFAGCSNGQAYAAGISDGADMAVAAACRVTAVRAAFAVAPSITPRGTCARKSMVEVHGTADPIVPYSGSAAGSFGDVPSEPVASRLPFWTSGCSGPVTIPAPSGTAIARWVCAGGRTFQLDTVNGGGHTWPGAVGAEPVAGLGARAPWSADAAAVAFFQSH